MPTRNNKNSLTLGRIFAGFLLTALFFGNSGGVYAQVMQSGNYKMEFDSVNAGGNRSNSTNYAVEDTQGEAGTGYSNSLNFTVHAGYQQSATTSTTPPPSSPPPATPPPAQPSLSDQNSGGNLIYDIVVTPGIRGAVITWKSMKETRAEINWGKTTGYEIGHMVEAQYTLVHRAEILDLVPGTTYQFELNAEDLYGRLGNYRASFTTLRLGENLPPSGISNFKAHTEGGGVGLTWKNPNDPDFDSVRILRSDKFFPTAPDEGQLVYEGRAESALDGNVQKGKTYYYAAFAKDSAGNWSSPAIVSIRITDEGVVVIGSPFDEFPQALEVDPAIASLTLDDILFLQDGIPVPRRGNELDIDGGKELVIAIPYDRLPEILKAIGITLTDPNDPTQTFSFLLKVTKSKDYYLATIGALEKGGKYEFSIHILDYQNQGLKKLAGNFLVSAALGAVSGPISQSAKDLLWIFLILFLLLLIALLLWYIAHRRVPSASASI